MAEALRSALKDSSDVAFIPYVTAGYPTADATVPIMKAMQEGGATAIELGVPFSDPLADGPTIQRAATAALKNGVGIAECLEYVKEARSLGVTIPIVLMGYYNPFYKYGNEEIVKAALEAGANAFIIVDLPIEEGDAFLDACEKHGAGFIPLVTPTTTEDRVSAIAKRASGFIYCVSVTGITGSRTALPEDLDTLVKKVRDATAAANKSLPVAVGFGLSTRDHVVAVGAIADGAIMGSIIIKTIDAAVAQGKDPADAIRAFVRKVTGNE